MRLIKFHSVANLEIFVNLSEIISVHHSVDPNAKSELVFGDLTLYVKEDIQYVLDNLPDQETTSAPKGFLSKLWGNK